MSDMLNYGYILPPQKPDTKFSFFRRPKIICKEMHKTENNALFFFYVPELKKGKLIGVLRQYNIEYIGLHPLFEKPELPGFKIVDGTNINRHLLLQAFFSYIKEKSVDIEKTGIHICASSTSDIYFLFDKISKSIASNNVHFVCATI